MSKKKTNPPRSVAELLSLKKYIEGRCSAFDECFNDVSNRSVNCFLAQKDETALAFREQLCSIRAKSDDAHSILCNLLLELSEAERAEQAVGCRDTVFSELVESD